MAAPSRNRSHTGSMLRLSAVLALLPLNCVHAISSHSPLDLLAFPAYTVKLNPGKPISNSSAERILAGRPDEAGNESGSGGAAASTSPLNEVQRFGQREQDSSGFNTFGDNTLPTKSFLMRSAGNGQAYLCAVPQHAPPVHHHREAADLAREEQALSQAEKEERRKKAEEDRRQAYERGLALLEPLKGTCLYLTQGWFTYAFCHGSEIRQFHAIRVHNPNGPGIAEDPTQESYTLGQFSNRIVEDEGLVDAKKARALGSLRDILESEDKDQQSAVGFVQGNGRAESDTLGDEKRYLVQRWSGGTLCDKTGVDRRVEVQFHCNSQSSDRIFLIRETAICEYVIVVHTPRLCGEPIFVGQGGADDSAAEKRKKAVNIIDCRPVIKDEVLALASASRAVPQVDPAPVSEALQQPGTAATVPKPDLPPEVQLAAQPTQEKGAQQPQTGPHALQPSDQQYLEEEMDFVLVVDPATGEMQLEASDDGSGILSDIDAGKLDGTEVFSGNSLDELLDKLKDVISNTAQKLNEAQQEQEAQQQEQQPEPLAEKGALRKRSHKQKVDLSNLSEKQKADQLSRLTRSGAHNHKAVAEAFVKGQTQAVQQQHQAQQQANAQQLPPQRQLGTPQHRNLKRAFETRWDGDDDSERQEGRLGRAAGEL